MYELLYFFCYVIISEKYASQVFEVYLFAILFLLQVSISSINTFIKYDINITT